MHLSKETKSAFVSLIVTFAQLTFVVFGICYGIAVYREDNPVGYLKATEMEIQEEEPLVRGLFERMDSTEGRNFLRQILLQRDPITVLDVLNRHNLCILDTEIHRYIQDNYGTEEKLDGHPVLRERIKQYEQRCSIIGAMRKR